MTATNRTGSNAALWIAAMALLFALGGGLAWAEEAQGPPAEVGQCTPGAEQAWMDAPPEAVPLTPCGSCTVSQFSPRWGVLCTFDGTCDHGQDPCCNYDCACGVTSGTGEPANACSLDIPTNCCPGFPTACTVTFCIAVGTRCTNNGCGVGCCTYSCVSDASCTVAVSPPPEAC